MSLESSVLPEWQRISGLTPEAEPAMSPDQRDDAIRTLFLRAEDMAIAELQRPRPAGERTILWDPLNRICERLGIARVKFSRYCYDLTGMRACEFTDRLKAQYWLIPRLKAWLEERIQVMEKFMRELYEATPVELRQLPDFWMKFCMREIREFQSGILAAEFATTMGFASTSRLKRACVLAFGKSLEHIEACILLQLVQKFLGSVAPVTAPENANPPEANAADPKPAPPKPPYNKPATADDGEATPLHPIVAEVLGQMAKEMAAKRRPA